jgi:hypothetical protein
MFVEIGAVWWSRVLRHLRSMPYSRAKANPPKVCIAAAQRCHSLAWGLVAGVHPSDPARGECLQVQVPRQTKSDIGKGPQGEIYASKARRGAQWGYIDRGAATDDVVGVQALSTAISLPLGTSHTSRTRAVASSDAAIGGRLEADRLVVVGNMRLPRSPGRPVSACTSCQRSDAQGAQAS